MNKRGDSRRLMNEVGFILFGLFIIGISIYFVVSKLNDTTLKARIFGEDIANTLEVMQFLPEENIKISYHLPENFKFDLNENFVLINDGKAEIKVPYRKNHDISLKFKRQKETLILEKNEKIA